MNIDLQPLWDFLSQTSNFIIGFNICMGYLIKKSPFISNKYIDLLVLLFSVAVTPYFFHPYILGVMWGVIYAVLSFKLYDWFFSWLFKIEPNREEEDPTRPRFITPPCYALLMIPLMCLPLVGCASFTEQQFIDAASKPANQSAGRFVLTHAGKVAVNQLVDRVDREAFKDQLRSWGAAVNKLLSTGEPITADDLAGIFSTFDSKLDSEKFAKQFGDVTSVVRDYLGEIRNSRVEVIRQWAVVLAQSAEAAGS